MSIMTKVVAASSAVTALAVGGAIALAVSGGNNPAAADSSGATITASATSLTDAATPTEASTAPAAPAPADSSAPAEAAAPVADAPAAVTGDTGSVESTQLTEDQAVAIALAQAPGASVDRVRMEPEHGALVWKVDLVAGGTEYEFRIDAGSGAIVRADVDGDDDSDDHDDDSDDDDHDDDRDDDDHGDDD